MSAVTAIDGIFVGHGVGSDGIAAVNICIPLLMIFTGIGLMAGVGSSVVASIHLARGKVKAARLNVTQALLFVTVVTLVPSVFVMSFPRQTAYLLGASEHLLPMVRDYLVWFVPSLTFQMWIAVSLFVIRLDGAPKFAMWCSIVSRTHQCRVGLAVHLSAGLGCDGRRFRHLGQYRDRRGDGSFLSVVFCPPSAIAPGETEQEEPEALAAQYRLPMPDRFFGSARRSDAGDVDVCR